LAEKRRKEPLKVEESISLGGYRIMFEQYDQAIEVLAEAETREPKNFRVLANLATAYVGKGLLDRAETYQAEAVSPRVWPRQLAGWTTEQLRWQHRAEQTFLTLLRTRYRDALRAPPGGGGAKEIKLDDIFPGVRFVGPDGRYAAGELDPKMLDKL